MYISALEKNFLASMWPCDILYGVFTQIILLSNLLVMFYQSKFQKHQAFEAEVSANQERVLETINLAEGEW